MLSSSDRDSPLANPIWHSLLTEHSHFAQGSELAKRYLDDIGPLSGIREQSEEAWCAVAELFSPGELAVLFLNEKPKVPGKLDLVRTFPIEQMLCDSPRIYRADVRIEQLHPADAPEMVALAELTEPGPFRKRTIELGGYCGIRDQDNLVAMAGQRTATPGCREVSAVCTHPNYRGRGYAAALVYAVCQGITGLGEIPFLHVRQDNRNAIRVYERLGFRIARTFQCTVVRPAVRREVQGHH
jgi:GNAT superfamily N-acetyltransferase